MVLSELIVKTSSKREQILCYRTNGGNYAASTTFRQFSPEVLVRGGFNYTQNLCFANEGHLKLVLYPKNFPTARKRPSNSGG